jgi:hypothetical protein
MLLSGSIAESIPLKFTFAHRLSVSLAVLALTALPTHLLAQATADAPPPPQADINSMPKWSEFPVPPTNITTAAEFKADVTETQARRQQLRTETRALVWDDTVPETFAADARGRIDPVLSGPVDAQVTPAQIDAMAAELRKRAAPPPVVK